MLSKEININNLTIIDVFVLVARRGGNGFHVYKDECRIVELFDRLLLHNYFDIKFNWKRYDNNECIHYQFIEHNEYDWNVYMGDLDVIEVIMNKN